MNTSVGILVLAAGGSSRLGYPKQLIEWGGSTLLKRSLTAALGAGAAHVGVVLGAEKASMEKEIADLPVNIFYNQNWEDGIGSSLKSGLKEFTGKFPELEAVLVMLCDQPFVDGRFLRKMILVYKSLKKEIIASKYENTLGVPALFAKNLFPSLLQIPDKKGAKQIIHSNLDLVEALYFPYGNFDIDTKKDVKALKKEKTRN